MKKLFSGPVVYHLLVFMLLVVPHSIYTNYIAKRDFELYLWNILVNDGLLLLVIYLNLYLLIPRFLQQKKYVLYFLFLSLLISIYIYGAYLMADLVQRRLKFEKEPIFYFIVSTAVNIVQYLLISFFLFNLKEKIEQEKRMDKMQLENLKTEINYLRAQINPHFLFNTLNNLYGLALERSDKTPEIVMRLSKMMDYMLYESDDAKVYLQKDIENISNYIEIEQIRQGNNAVITYKVDGTINNQKIVPLLLLPLVENGFKHGVNKQVRDAFLNIQLNVFAESVKIYVVNNYKVLQDNLESRNGIGLGNLKRRLQLSYPGKHELVTTQNDGHYEATLTIYLS